MGNFLRHGELNEAKNLRCGAKSLLQRKKCAAAKAHEPILSSEFHDNRPSIKGNSELKTVNPTDPLAN